MKVGERKRIDEAESGLVVGFRFAREAGNDVSANGCVREKFANEFYTTGVVLRAIPPMHGGENIVRAGLERHVEMLRNAIGASEECDEILGDVERLD